MSFDLDEVNACFNPKMPVKFVGGFLIFVIIAISLMWLERIIPSLVNGTAPFGLEHYTTLVIQALDLGFVLSAALLSGVLLIKRKPFGYLLASVIIIKAITLLAAIIAMALMEVFAGVKVSIVEMIVFPLFNVVAIYRLVLIMRNSTCLGLFFQIGGGSLNKNIW